jgi:transposase InsO family protein
VWSYDFLSTRTQDGGPLRVLDVVDEYTRRALGCKVDRHIGARDVVAELHTLFKTHGKPRFIRSDNGREFIAQSTRSWLAEQGVQPIFIERGSSQQNPYLERFNGAMRDELLNGEHFDSPAGGAGRDRPLGQGVQHPASSSRPGLPDATGVL